MIGEKVEERRRFTKEERLAILKSSYGICACCGKKLTGKTMTVEHIIPLARGGTNEMKNLVALCEVCNKRKKNLLFLPYGFYAALRNKPRFYEMEHDVRDWFKTIKDEFDTERYPLIAPEFLMQLDPVGDEMNKKMTAYSSQLTFKWQLVSKNSKKEVETAMGMSVDEVREQMMLLCNRKEKHPTPLYYLRKLSTNKVLAVIAVKYWKNDNAAIYIPWHGLPKLYSKAMVFNFVCNFVTSIVKVAEETLTDYTICSKYKELADVFEGYKAVPQFVMTAVQIGYIEDNETKEPAFYVCNASRRPHLTIEDVRGDLFKKIV